MIAELISVSKIYEPGNPPVLDGISLAVNESDAIAITGPSGSGKSTLLNILGTIDNASSGRVLIGGKEMNSLNNNARAELRNRYIGFVFQKHHLLPQLTLLENILLPAVPGRVKENEKLILERAIHLMDRVGISNLSNKFPGKASLGECQRAAVVRALINKPAILLADEPTGSLDNENALKLASLLRELNDEEKTAMLVVTHSPEIASMMKIHYRLHNAKLEKNP